MVKLAGQEHYVRGLLNQAGVAALVNHAANGFQDSLGSEGTVLNREGVGHRGAESGLRSPCARSKSLRDERQIDHQS